MNKAQNNNIRIYSTTPPPAATTTTQETTRRAPIIQRRKQQAPFTRTQRLNAGPGAVIPKNTYRPVIDYDYYDDGDIKLIRNSNTKVPCF